MPMGSIQKYDIFYTQSAIADIEDKADYIAFQLHSPDMAEAWYKQLRETIRKNLSTFPLKYASYHTEPWAERGIRLFAARNDVILYSVDTSAHIVYIWSVCTKGRDLAAHLESLQEE